VKGKVLRDSWLAPLTMDAKTLANEAQPNPTVLRASDKGFLNIRWRDYVELLSWSAKQRVQELIEDVPDSLKAVLSQVGKPAGIRKPVALSKPRDSHFKKFIG
jgi:hypothetical protein